MRQSSALPFVTARSWLDLLAEVGAVAVVAGVMFWVVVSPYPPLQDYLEWVYQGFLFKQLLSGNADIAARFAIAPYPVANSLSQAALGLLMFVASPFAAAKIWILAYLIAFASLCGLIARRVTAEDYGKLLLVLVSAVMLGSAFWNGYINFQYSLLILAAYLYLAHGRESLNWPVVLVFSLLLFFCHAITFAAFGLLVVLSAVYPRFRPDLLIALIPSAALSLWYVAAAFGGGGLPVWDRLAPLVLYKGYTVMKLGPFQNFILADGRGWLERLAAVYWIGVALNGLFALFLGLGVALSLPRLLSPMGIRQALRLAAVVILAILFLASPSFAFGVNNLGERFLVIALLLLLSSFAIRPAFLALMALAVLLVVPYDLAFFRSTAGQQVWATNYQEPENESLAAALDSIYAKTRFRYFNHTPYQFAAEAAYLRNPSGRAPDIGARFFSSVIQKRGTPARSG